jgi:hypothetical protein
MKFSDIFKTSDQNGSLGDRFRKRRFKFFEEKLAGLDGPLTILDVGGLESFWVNRGFANKPGVTITVLNLTSGETHHDNIKAVSGNATSLSGIKDSEFDIVFSNSVIEHLYTKENQIKMAEEVKRAGKYYFVQTPNKYFPIEPHYVLPFFQYLPKSVKYFILTKTRLSRLHKWDKDYAKQYIEEIRLLSFKEMKELFPEGSIYCEKAGGLIKSFTAHNF